LTRIVTNSLLQPTNRTISNVNSVFMTNDGPNLSTKIDLIDLGIPYDTHYISRLVLPANAENFLLNYGTLTNTTFLLLKVTYNGDYDNPKEDDMDPYYRQEPETFNITYYFEGNTGATFPIGRLLLLSGSFLNKLPKIYLNNPLDYGVSVHVLHANIEPYKVVPTTTGITITNLYYSDITTNQVQCLVNSGLTGSTAFIVSGYTGEIIIPYSAITYIQRDLPLLSIYVFTTTMGTITLKFLTEFDCNQAYSRMMFAMVEDTCRYLTEDNVYGGICSGSTDTTSPVIYYNNSIYWSGSGTTIPYDVVLPSGTTWTIDQLKYLFISGITDCWDGNIPISAVTLELFNNCYNTTGITGDGIYNIIITIIDNAGNITSNNIINIVVDSLPPVIEYQYGVLNSGLTGDTITYSGASSGITSNIIISNGFILTGTTISIITFSGVTGITTGFTNLDRMDILTNIVEGVYDIVDLSLNKYMLNVLIVDESLTYTEVSVAKDYCVKLSIIDIGGNEAVDYLIMRVV